MDIEGPTSDDLTVPALTFFYLRSARKLDEL